jgi:hypothetical protein
MNQHTRPTLRHVWRLIQPIADPILFRPEHIWPNLPKRIVFPVRVVVLVNKRRHLLGIVEVNCQTKLVADCRQPSANRHPAGCP